MKNTIDEYYSDGNFEVIRSGRFTQLTNKMSETDHKNHMEKLKSDYSDVKNTINALVSKIRNKVISCDPLELLSFSYLQFLLSSIGIESEIDSNPDDFPSMRMAEYIQSILVSSPNYFDPSKERSDPSEEYNSILADISYLYSKISYFYLCWGALLIDQNPDWDDSLIENIVESQMLYNVRGAHYQVHEIEYLERLLLNHNDELKNLFSMTADDVVKGIAKLQYALTQGTMDAMQGLFPKYCSFLSDNNGVTNTFSDADNHEGEILHGGILGTKFHDVISITGWNRAFVEALSFSLNEDTTFFSDTDYPGWPIVDMPIQKRPFIKLGNAFYCYDYYSLLDNFYRVLQKTIARLHPEYSWSDRQKETSEKMVEAIFQKLLPNCLTYRDNYYPLKESLKQNAENDLLVLYADTLIIIEVKAGSFVYTPPITDFPTHIESYKALIEKADWQCNRAYNYLTNKKAPYIYDRNNQKKATIDMSAINEVYMMSVTIDNINDFAARANKLGFLKLRSNAICLSIDDLMVYRDYFNSPLLFLHFLRQRKLSIREERLALNDELDHLGMYLAHNCYPMQLKGVQENVRHHFWGYRQELDKYFCRLYHPQIISKKPLPNIPPLFISIVNYIENSDVSEKTQLANYLLDFSIEAKEQFSEYVQQVLVHQKKTHITQAISAEGGSDSLRFSCFINHPQIPSLSHEEKRRNTLALLLWNHEQNRMLLDLYFDDSDRFVKIDFKQLSEEDIQSGEREVLCALGEQKNTLRLAKCKTENGKKIGRNQLCPCGSGKKYKTCCGR